MTPDEWSMFYTVIVSVFLGLMFAFGFAAGSQWQ